jgi:hypothetical protein
VSWHQADLVSDEDLKSYESEILARFGQSDWQTRRTKALEDWLFPHLKTRGFDPYKLRTRYECDSVLGYTASTYSDKTDVTKDTGENDLNLATVFTTVGTDALYIGSSQPFRGIFLRLLDSVSSVTSVMTVAYWSGTWEALDATDRTAQSGKTLAAGGSVTWTLPVDWATRKVNSIGPYYWVKVTVSATPTSALASQIGVIRASSLRAPVTFRTLQLIFQEAPTGADGPWAEKAAFYKDEAEGALLRALEIVGGEFDTDASDLVSQEESEQTAEEVGGGPFTLERA